MVEELVRSKFNSRMIIRDVLMQPSLHLLKSRSYFNLIFIEEQLCSRMETFQKETRKLYPSIALQMQDIINFILLDEFVLILLCSSTANSSLDA